MAPRPRLSAVVPCFDEEQSLIALFERLRQACAALVGDDYEVVLVDDGSTDATWSLITQRARRSPRVVGISLSRNHGHQLALTAGLTMCTGERILIIDADLQDPPELLGAMMDLMDRGADVVYGRRASRRGESWWKRLTAALFYRLIGFLTDTEIPLDTGDFRLLSRRALDILLAMPERHRFVRGMVSWIGLRQEPLSYTRAERYAGHTKYPPSRMIHLAVDAITGFSVRPLRIASYLGLLLAALAMAVLAYTLFRWLSGATVPGWTSVMAVILILGSAQMVVLGVIGEYLGRLFLESKRRPLFIIDRLIADGREVTVRPLELQRVPLEGWPMAASQTPVPPHPASPAPQPAATEPAAPEHAALPRARSSRSRSRGRPD